MSILYLVSTPIGNLSDVSARAEETLRSVDRILAEDTRHSRVLTDRVGTSAPLVSLHQHNERQRLDQVLGWLENGENLALISDAGTPLVSDPGATLVRAVADAGHTVTPIPGPSAVLTALVASGLPTARFLFLGFPEKKGRARQDLLARVATSQETVVLFESPQRTVRLLDDLAEACGPERQVTVARELTKVHEEFQRGTLRDVAAYYGDHPPKGEVTVVVGPRSVADDEAVKNERVGNAKSLARELAEQGLAPSAAAKEIAKRLDLPRNEAYRIVHDPGKSTEDA